MESLSRPPHRRKHSTTTNASSSSFSSSSLKNPYDDVLLSSVGKTKFKVHEFAEIFSGPSSIPVLDLTGLDERVGSDDCWSSKLDYRNIFGGLRDDDVAAPYEELFNNGAAKKTETRIPADAQSHFQESGSLHSPGKMKNSSNEAYDQPADGVKPHLNMSFNKTSESNSDASSGKTHIAQLHDTPGFTYFVDGNQRLQKTEGDKPVSSLKREVSRTWSFSTGVDAVTVNGGLSSEKPHIPNKSDNLNKISKMPSPPVHLSDPNDNKDLRHSRLPSFASKEFSEKAAAEQPPPSSDEELDENSVAAVSAAALKKAIEQAQESIKIAKMIMERKMEVLEDGSKPSSKVRSKVKGKKDTRIGHEPDVLEEKSARERHERVDPTLSTSAGIDGEFAPSLSNSDEFLNAQNAEMGRVRENVGVAKDHGDTLPEVGKEFATSCTQSETIHIAKKVEFENVEAADVSLEATNFTGLVANTEHRTENSEYEKVDDKDNLVCSTYKVESRRVEMETGKETLEQRESTIHQSKEPEIIAEMAEIAPKSSVRVEEVDEDFEQCQATVDFQKGAKNIAELWEGSPDCSQSTQEQEKTTHEAVENSKISQDDIVTEESDDLADDNGKCEEKFVEHEEMGYGEHLKVLKSDFRNLLNESQALTEKEIPEPEDTEQSENIPAWEENSQHGKSGDEQELKEPVEEEISEREPKVSPKVEEAGQQVNVVHELEMNDETPNCGHDGLQKLPREYKPDEIADRNMDTSEFEAAQSIQMEADYYAEVLKGKFPGDAEETDRNARNEEDQDESKIRETDSDEEYDEAAVNARNNYSGTFSSATDSTDTSTIFSEAQEPCDVELNNKSEEHQEAVNGYEESDRLDEVTDTFSVTEDSEAGKPLHLDVNEMPRTTSMHKCASDENLMGSTLKNTFEGLSADSKTENISLMDTDHEETLQEDEDMFEKANQVHTAAPEYAAEINEQNLPEVRTSSYKVEEFDYTNVKPVPERNPASSEGSASTSILENVDDVSVHEAQACAENAKDNTSTKEEVGDGPDMTSDDKEDVEEQCERIYSEDQSEGAYSQSNCDVTEEKGEDMEMNKENLRETSTIAQKDSKLNEQKFETDDPQQRIEAIKRGREREKDRMAVERAIREARERAFAEARERAERAAVEKAAAEARQRFMKEAREKLEKTSVETKQPVDKASTEVKLRAERAAVERATAEARERALEKAMSQRTSIEARAQGDRHPSERVSSSSRNNGLKHSFSSSDLEKLDGTSNESAQRRKARLERHQRIMERAAKALAEKNMRDLLVQKEQAERNRLAESLDADIKRWAMGKEGNLRALLSTLQYILGSESGWQPVSLTEIITTVAVRKAYRKATLCVHPDKLQQRGASIRQKYICEKVFDLLKYSYPLSCSTNIQAAWNRFNSEER